jgi:ferrous iron transport protein A
MNGLANPNPAEAEAGSVRLSLASRGARGQIVALAVEEGSHHGVEAAELERRLLEMGFVEGAQFEVLHEGLIGRDPMAIRLDDRRVALRRREARVVLVKLDVQPKGRSPS